jgi:hypothetical protein
MLAAVEGETMFGGSPGGYCLGLHFARRRNSSLGATEWGKWAWDRRLLLQAGRRELFEVGFAKGEW